MAETKPKTADSLRTPGPKKKLGLSVPSALRLPHEDLIRPEKDVQVASMPSPTSHTSTSSPASQTSQTRHSDNKPSDNVPAAPQRDYAKVANSITRQALPSGVFKGKSKQLYDCLYSLTRGAVVPSRTVRISRPKLMKKAHIGSRVTFDSNINHLLVTGLVKVRQIIGEHEGNEYEVLLPEEVEISIPSQTSQSSQSSLTGYAQKLDRLVSLETSQTRHSLSDLESTASTEAKTSFKTNTEKTDDEAGAAVRCAISNLIKEVTGREVTSIEYGKIVEVIEVLTLEAKIAAARTTVSSAGPFLAEHLRRRLFKKNKQELAVETAQSEPISPTIDVSRCTECAGIGWYYPDGKEKGMAKCKHPSLLGQPTISPSTENTETSN